MSPYYIKKHEQIKTPGGNYSKEWVNVTRSASGTIIFARLEQAVAYADTIREDTQIYDSATHKRIKTI